MALHSEPPDHYDLLSHLLSRRHARDQRLYTAIALTS